MVCDIGDVIELTATFEDHKTGNAAEPDSVSCTVQMPSGETVTPDVGNEGDGKYVALFAPEESGSYAYAFDGTGGHQASGERCFRVRKRTVPRD